MKIYSIRMNYAAHTREFKNELQGELVVFMKPVSAVTGENKPFKIPAWSKDLHNEAELLVKISKPGKDIAPEQARTQ